MQVGSDGWNYACVPIMVHRPHMFWTIYSIAFLVWIYNCLLVTVYKPKLVVDIIELSFKFLPK
jgi:hypothetical protein